MVLSAVPDRPLCVVCSFYHPPYVCYTFSLRLNCVETIRKNTISCHKFYNKNAILTFSKDRSGFSNYFAVSTV